MIGPNGAGKSTMLKAVYGLVTRYAGSVRFAGEDVTGLRPDRLTRRGLNFVPQTENVFPSLTLAENVHVSALARPEGGARAPQSSASASSSRSSPSGRGSAPARSRAASASSSRSRARSSRGPRLLLLDEPSAGLSPQAMETVFEKLVEINAIGIGIVMVEQNARRALALAHRGYVLDAGRNAIEGSGADLLRDPQVAELYLGGSRTTASSSNSTSTPSGMNPETK